MEAVEMSLEALACPELTARGRYFRTFGVQKAKQVFDVESNSRGRTANYEALPDSRAAHSRGSAVLAVIGCRQTPSVADHGHRP
jgi:hypothetical protein